MAIKLTELSLATLHLIDDGGPEHLFQSLMLKLVRDAESRPNVDGKRKVKLEFEVESFLNPKTMEVDTVALTVFGSLALPAFHTEPHKLRTNQGRLLFHAETPESPDQHTMDFPAPVPAPTQTAQVKQPPE
jgi:hypothetical protein